MDRAEPDHMAMMKLADDHNDPPPPIPDVPYVIGLDGGPLHAVRHAAAVDAAALVEPGKWLTVARAVCGQSVRIARAWGEFTRDNDNLTVHGVCPECEWEAAIESGTTATTVAAMYRHAQREYNAGAGTDLTLAVRVCEAILASDKHDVEYPLVLQLLAHATRHAPVVLLNESCAEGDCEDHDSPADCRAQASFVACAACSLQAGPWAGEWEGQYGVECTIPAPCGVLLTLAHHYGVHPVGIPGDPAEPRLAAGMYVRQVWVQWAREQPRPKPSWLLPWDRLDPGQQEVDMRIGDALWSAGRAVGLQEAALLANPLLDRP